MSLDAARFWQLVSESGLLSTENCQALQNEFAGMKGADAGNPKAIAEWLVSRNIISRYQTKILLAGRPGPFSYEEYKIYDRVAEGRLKGRFRAVHGVSGHPVTLSFYTGGITKDEGLWTALGQRLAQQKKIRHPRMQDLFERVDVSAFKFLVVEDVYGKTWAEQFANGARLEANDACIMIGQAAMALGALHSAGLIHGSVQPKNLWISTDNTCKVLRDVETIGLNTDFSSDTELLESQADYLAPEMIQVGQMPSARADVYALGCCFYQLLTGVAPFAGPESVTEKTQKHATLAIQDLAQFGVSQPIAEIVQYMMAKNPDVRFGDCKQVAQRLGTLVDLGSFAQFQNSPPTEVSYRAHLEQKDAAPDVPQIPDFGGNAVPPSTPQININAGSEAPTSASSSIQISDASDSSASSSYRRRPKPSWLQRNLIWIVGVLIIGGGIGWVVYLQSESGVKSDDGTTADAKQDGDSKGGGGNSKTNRGKGGLDKSKSGKQGNRKVTRTGSSSTDDGTSLWQSPTTGERISLKLLPPGAQVILVLRPAEIMQSTEGKRTVEAFGPAVKAMLEQFERASGTPFASIKQLVIGIHDNGEEMPRPSFVVRPAEKTTRTNLLAKWGNPQVSASEKGEYFTGATMAFHLPSGDEVSEFAMGYVDEIKEMVEEFSGEEPPMRRGMGTLMSTSDDKRHFTLVFAPNFVSSALFRDGRDFYFGPARKAREPIEWLLAKEMDAGLFSMHFSDPFYWEFRFHSTLDSDRTQMAEALRTRMKEMPRRLENYLEQINPDLYWRKVSFRYANMIGFLHDYTRVQDEDKHAVINGVLPAHGAHNLIFGGELLLASEPGQAAVAVAPPASGPKTLDELLNENFSIEIPQQDLVLAVDEISKDIQARFRGMPFPFGIEIIGKDLQLEGITQNQAIRDFKLEDATLSQVLTGLVMKANPDTTVKEPSEENQKLIWVIGPDPKDNSKNVILITTRKAAATKGYKLPPAFQPKT